MRLLNLKWIGWSALIGLSLAISIRAGASATVPRNCIHAFPKSEAEVWQFLRDERLLMASGTRDLEFDCGAVCAVNVAQAVAVSSGRPPLSRPEEAFDLIYSKFGERLYQSQTALAIRLLLDTYYPGVNAEIQSHLLIGPNDPHAQNTIRLPTITEQDLKPLASRLILTSSLHFYSDGRMALQHSQIFAYASENGVAIIEPTDPYANVSAVAREIAKLEGAHVPLFHLLNTNTTANRFAPFGFISVVVAR